MLNYCVLLVYVCVRKCYCMLNYCVLLVFVCVSVCVCCLCVCVVGVCEAAGGEGVPEEPGIQNQKQEPHTKMWGITFMSAGSGKSKIFNGSSD